MKYDILKMQILRIKRGIYMNLPEKFNDFSEARRNGFINVKNLKEEGKKVVGTFCTFTPWEIIAASGAVPVSLCGKNEEPIADAEKILPRNLCPLIKSSFGFALTDKCPYTYFSDLIVGETTCDGKKKMYEYLNNIRPVHVMQLPQTNKGDDAFNLWKSEIIKLKNILEKEFDVTITDEMLRNAIAERNNVRGALIEFCELGKLNPPAVTGMEIMKVLGGASFKWDTNSLISEINSITKESLDKYNEGEKKVSFEAKRILVTGCPMGEGTEKIIKLIEENGGVVVCYENCTGIKEIERLVDENIDPYDALTEKYINIGCSCMSPNDNRLHLLSDLIADYNVDGVVDVILQACHTYSVETFGVKSFIEENFEVPYMSIETDYSKSDTGQLKTRIAAFIEML